MKYSKGEFIIIPNKSRLKGVGANQQVVYMWLCEHSDDNMESFPSRKVLAEECGVSCRTLDRALQHLCDKGLVVKSARIVENKQSSNLYKVVIFARGDNLTRGGDKSARGGATKTTHRTQPNSNSTQLTQNVSKDTLAKAYGKPEVNELFEYWESATGMPVTSRVQANRRAAHTLLSQHGREKLGQLIDGVVLAQADQYAPRIGDFTDLQSKLNTLLVWGKQRNKSNKIGVIE